MDIKIIIVIVLFIVIVIFVLYSKINESIEKISSFIKKIDSSKIKNDILDNFNYKEKSNELEYLENFINNLDSRDITRCDMNKVGNFSSDSILEYFKHKGFHVIPEKIQKGFKCKLESNETVFYMINNKWHLSDKWSIINGHKYFLPEGLLKINKGSLYEFTEYKGPDIIIFKIIKIKEK